MKRGSLSALFVGLLIVGIAAPAWARQAGDPLPLRIEDVNTSDHPSVIITVSVPKALIGVELPRESFTVEENGTVRSLAVEAVPTDDLQVVLLLDVSGSMSGEPLRAARDAALSFIEQLPPGVEVALVTFASTPEVVSAFTVETDDTVTALQRLRTGGETSLYDGLVVAGEQFELAENTRRTIVLLSDGGDTSSESTLEEALISLLDVEVGFYAIELQSPENDPEALSRLAVATQGTVVPATDPAALAGIFDEIAAQLTNQYRLTYASDTFGQTEVTVTVETAAATASTTATVRLPAGPPPPQSQPAETTPEPPVAGPVPEVDTFPLRPGSLVTLTWLQRRPAFFVGLVLVIAALVGTFLFATRNYRRKEEKVVQLTSDDPERFAKSKNPALSALAQRATELAERSIRGERAGKINQLLERAGMSMRPAEFVVLTLVAMIVGATIGAILIGIPGTLIAAALVPLLARAYVGWKAEKRKAAFAEQLPDTLYLIGGSLRAGFGLLQAMDVIASEAPSPTAEEFQRVKVEIHLGRDMDEALRAMAERVGSEDFKWVTEAIEIHREVGGDIAEIIDSVNTTIRDRNQIRRRIKSLSAEGRISALVLIMLPFILAVLVAFINPGYLAELTTSNVGRLLIVVGLVAMVIGVVWIRKIVKLEF